MSNRYNLFKINQVQDKVKPPRKMVKVVCEITCMCREWLLVLCRCCKNKHLVEAK